MSRAAHSSPRHGCASERPLLPAAGRHADWRPALAAALLVHLSGALLLLQLQAPRAPLAGPDRFLEVTLADLGRPSAAAVADATALRPADPPPALETLPPAEGVQAIEVSAPVPDSPSAEQVAAEASSMAPVAVNAVAAGLAAAGALATQAREPAAPAAPTSGAPTPVTPTPVTPTPAAPPSGIPDSSAPPAGPEAGGEARAEAGDEPEAAAGTGRGPASAGAAAEEAYLQRLAAWLGRYRRYPRRARRLGQEGVVLVRFRLDAWGRVLESGLQQGSGHELLDAEALDLLSRAAPLPPPPSGAHLPLELVVPVRFALH